MKKPIRDWIDFALGLLMLVCGVSLLANSIVNRSEQQERLDTINQRMTELDEQLRRVEAKVDASPERPARQD